jgi:hypothetical protein
MAQGDFLYYATARGNIEIDDASTTLVTVVTSPTLSVASDYIFNVRGELLCFRNGSFVTGTDIFVYSGHCDAGVLVLGGSISITNSGAGSIAAGTLGVTSMDVSGATIRLRFTPVAGAANQNLTLRGKFRIAAYTHASPGISASP